MQLFSWFLVVLAVCAFVQYHTVQSSLQLVEGSTKGAANTYQPKLQFQPTRPYLVFSSVGSDSLAGITSWTIGTNRSFDIVLYYYDDIVPYVCFEFCYVRRDYKWPNFYHFLESTGLGQDAYSAALVIDDDFIMNGTDIDELFSIFDKFDFLFAQPSLRKGSDMHWGRHQAHRKGEYFRYINFVENSVTVIRFSRAIKLKRLFKVAGTGYGVDFCMMSLSNISITDVALIHKITAFHPFHSRVSKASVDYSAEFATQAAARAFRRKNKLKSQNQIAGEQMGREQGCIFYKPKFGMRVNEGYTLPQALARVGVHPTSRTLRPRWLCVNETNVPCFHRYEEFTFKGPPYFQVVKDVGS